MSNDFIETDYERRIRLTTKHGWYDGWRAEDRKPPTITVGNYHCRGWGRIGSP
jgi:hypothetical protein